MPTRDRPEEPDLVDLNLAVEIQLLGAVIAAAGRHPGPLNVADLDVALGIDDTPRQVRPDHSPGPEP